MVGALRIYSLLPVALLLAVLARAESDVTVLEADSPAPSIDWSAHLQPVDASDPELTILYSRLHEALAAGSLDEAETLGKQLVERASLAVGTAGPVRARALHDLAVTQHAGGDYPSAILNYQAAIDAVVEASDMLSADLVAPLHALGLAYGDSGEPVAAMSAFERALHISNVNQGPHSLVQEPLLLSITALQERHGDVESATEMLERIYQLHLRASGPESEALLPVLRRQAEFYERHRMYGREYTAWYESLMIIRKHRGANDLSLIEPQIRLSRAMIRGLDRVVYRSSGPTAPSAEKYLKRALAIANNNADADWRDRRRTLLALADYYLLVGTSSLAHRYYKQAWELLSAETQIEQRRLDLQSSVPVARPHPDPYANFEYNPDVDEIDPDQYRPGLMVAEFTIDERGRVDDVEIVEQEPADFDRMEWRLRQSLKDFVYRPRFVDGEPVPTESYRYRLEYFYLPSEYEASLEKSGKLKRPKTP